jgi:hypothetical protein
MPPAHHRDRRLGGPEHAHLLVLGRGGRQRAAVRFRRVPIVGRLPAITASLGSLLTPVVGVSASAIYLEERLTVPDIIGFLMIFAAAACVLLQPTVKHTEMPE